ncbi:hypothetical protein ACUN24_15060 [Pedobacter sp. WC2501]|nr:hypothetical protein [uncultured Pedobacter sp.]
MKNRILISVIDISNIPISIDEVYLSKYLCKFKICFIQMEYRM